MAQIGTIQVQTGGLGRVDLPVFEPSDIGGETLESLRVETGTGVGVIPFVVPDNAAFPYVRIQTNNHGVLAAHDTPDTTVDSFEDTSLSEYGGETADFSTVTDSTAAVDGDVYLTSSNSNNRFISSTSGLPRYPARGDVFGAWIRTEGTGGEIDVDFAYGVPSETGNANREGYSVAISASNDELTFRKFTSGSGTDIQTSAATINQSQWYLAVIDWQTDDTHDIELYTDETDPTLVSSLSASDSDFANEIGIGWLNPGGDFEKRFEYCRLGSTRFA